jgi:hypothetical protein
MKRITIAQMLGVVAVVAVGLAAIRAGTETWFKAVYTLTLAMLMVSLLGAIVRPRDRRAGWMGFALFGWAAFLSISVPDIQGQFAQGFLGFDLLDRSIVLLHRAPPRPAGLPGENTPEYRAMFDAYRTMKISGAGNLIVMSYYPEYDPYFGALDAYGERVQFAGETARWLLCPLAGLVGAILGRILGPREGMSGPTRPGA